MKTVTLTIDGVNRLYLYEGLPGPNLQSPVLIFLHGTGGTAAWAAEETGWPKYARSAGYTLVVPEGLSPDPTKPPKFLTNPPRWNDGSTQPGDPLHSDADDVRFLNAVIDDVFERAQDGSGPVFLCGFSNGAGMTFRYAAEHAEKIAAIIPVAGHCWIADPRPSQPVRTLYIIGTADPLIPLRGGPVRLPWGGRLIRRPAVLETLEIWAAANDCKMVPILTSDQNGVREEIYPPGVGGSEFRVQYVHGLGHHWPGGKGQLNPRIGGPAGGTLVATEAILNFCRGAPPSAAD